MRHAHAGVVAEGDHRLQRGCVDGGLHIVGRAFVCRQSLPTRQRGVPIGALRRGGATLQVIVRSVVRGNQACARAGFDGHVADGHALFHRKRADGRAGKLEDAACAAADTDFGDEREDDVLGRDAWPQRAIHLHREALRLALQQALRGQDVLHFAGADAEGERAKRPVRGCMRVAADHGHAGLSEAVFRADDVNDAVPVAEIVEQRDAEILAVRAELFDLGPSDSVYDGQRLIGGRRRVIAGGDRQVGPAHLQAALAKTGESLRRGDLMDQVEVDVEQRGRVSVGT